MHGKQMSDKSIMRWIHRIKSSNLSVREYFKTHDVPFSRDRYYFYVKRQVLLEQGQVLNLRQRRGNTAKSRKFDEKHEGFIQGLIMATPEITANTLQKKLFAAFGIDVSLSLISIVRNKLFPDSYKPTIGRPKSRTNEIEINPLGGFELIVALGYHLGWPQHVQSIICKAVNSLKKTTEFSENTKYKDIQGRNKAGQFTTKYTKRSDVRKNRFGSISDKIKTKNWQSMNIIRDGENTIIRKNVAILSLPVITANGKVRTINTANGRSLKYLCGVNYSQSTIAKYLAELKYLRISTTLLQAIGSFWGQYWQDEFNDATRCPLLCYYIDGNTKALWSSQRVKQNKVTMLGRVMGCLEQMFINDMYGHPIYLETYAGHGPTGKHILALFEKIEDSISEVPGSRTNVCRAIIMDSASNSVETLREFAKQEEYYYITPLDDNQLTERKILHKGRSSRYEYGDGKLQELILELEDSKDKKFLITSRAIHITWDNGKTIVLLNNLPEFINSSEVVQAYFKRWPAQELQFKKFKAAVSLSRVVGYGRKLVKNEKAMEKINKLNSQIIELRKVLELPIAMIEKHEAAISKLIIQERKIKAKSKIKGGVRLVPKKYQQEFNTHAKKISHHKNEINKIKKLYAKIRVLREKQQKWLNLQSKKYEYEIDVELDQLVTFFRINLANMLAYFIRHFLGDISISMVMLIEKIINLTGVIESTSMMRKITLNWNKHDQETIKILKPAIAKINKLNIDGIDGKKYFFALAHNG